MTLQEFKKHITKASWFDKYYYYFISFAVIGVGFVFLYLAFFDNTTRHLTTESRIFIFCASLFFFSLGTISLYLIPNRYKILTFDSNLSSENKKKIIAETMKAFDAFFVDDPNCFWSFSYSRKWWTFTYNVYLTFDSDNIFASIVGRTYGRGGFIDFGQTEKLRRKLSSTILKKIEKE